MIEFIIGVPIFLIGLIIFYLFGYFFIKYDLDWECPLLDKNNIYDCIFTGFSRIGIFVLVILITTLIGTIFNNLL